MIGKRVRIAVVWTSILMAAMGFAAFAYFRYTGQPRPLWDLVAMTYGGVFVVFLLFDIIGREAAQHRRERDAMAQRPRPQVASNPGRQAAVHTRLTMGQVRLERVRVGDVNQFNRLVADAAAEVLALEDQARSAEDIDNLSGETGQWFDKPNYYPFHIMYHDTCIGCCVLKSVHPVHEIVLFYILPDMRRRRGGTVALVKLLEFACLVGSHPDIQCEISQRNMRGKRFFEHNGFRVLNETGLPPERITMAKNMSDAQI